MYSITNTTRELTEYVRAAYDSRGKRTKKRASLRNKGACGLSTGQKRRGVSARKQAAAMGFVGKVEAQLIAVEAALAESRARLKKVEAVAI